MGIAVSQLLCFVVGVVTASIFWVWIFQTQCRRSRGERGDGWLRFTANNATNTSTFALTSGHQDTSFISDMMRGLWPDVRVVAEASIREILCETLRQARIGCTLHTLDLGSVPPRFDNVTVKERKGNSLQMDVDLIWHAAVKVRLASALGTFGIRSVYLRGRMSILFMPLSSDHAAIVQAVQYGFINTPELKLEFSGLATIADLRVLERKIYRVIEQTIESMCVLPRRMPLPLVPGCNLIDMYQPPLGIARVTLLHGRGFQVQKGRFGKKADIPDVYCNIQLGPSEPNNPVWRTATIRDNLSPVWTDSCRDFLLCDFDQMLSVHAWDEDKGALDADDDLGQAKVSIGELLLSGGTRELELYDGQGSTTDCFISVHCSHIPITTDLSSFDDRSPVQNTTTNRVSGLLTVIVTNGMNLPVQPSKNAMHVVVTIDDENMRDSLHYSTATVSDNAANPQFGSVFHALVQRPRSASLTLFNHKQVLTKVTLSYDELNSAENHCCVQKQTVGKDGWFQYSVRLYGFQQLPAVVRPPTSDSIPITVLNSSFDSLDSLQTTPLLGCKSARKVRITLLRGYGFVIQRFRFKKDDIPDVYCQITFNQVNWRTKTIRDSTAPEFNESRDFFLQSTNHFVNIDVFDQDKYSKDDELGSAAITIGRLLLAPATEVEIQQNGRGSGAFLVLSAELIEEDSVSSLTKGKEE